VILQISFIGCFLGAVLCMGWSLGAIVARTSEPHLVAILGVIAAFAFAVIGGLIGLLM
jgi:hypothetical protein